MTRAKKDEGATADQLREEIDRGGAGDKTAFSDPAAAPLGTDDEAAGTPPTSDQVDTATAAEATRHQPADSKKGPAELQGNRMNSGTIAGFIAALVALLALILWLT